METIHDLIARYASRPPKLLCRWHDARLELETAGEAFVAAGRPHGSPEDAALVAAERWEQSCYDVVFAPRLGA